MTAHRADWERIEADYRVGVRTLREIAAEHALTEGAIRKRAKRDGWQKDLSAKVRAKAAELVRTESVRTEQSTQPEPEYEPKRTKPQTEQAVIDIEANVQARIQIAHRKDIGRGRNLTMMLLAELEAQTSQVPELAKLGELMAKPDKGIDKLNEVYHKIISLGSRTGTMKALAESMSKLVSMEREAFSIESKPDDPAKVAEQTVRDISALQERFKVVLGRTA